MIKTLFIVISISHYLFFFVLLQMLFGDTEIKASAMDIGSKQTVRAYVDFLNESNPKYTTKM